MPASNPGFADRLITLLTQAGLRPADLAVRIAMSVETVEDYLRGTMPDALSLYRIAKALVELPRLRGQVRAWDFP